jgi:hypothetical protein
LLLSFWTSKKKVKVSKENKMKIVTKRNNPCPPTVHAILMNVSLKGHHRSSFTHEQLEKNENYNPAPAGQAKRNTRGLPLQGIGVCWTTSENCNKT